MTNVPKRKVGRPKMKTRQEFKSISVKKELWVEMYNQAHAAGTTIGKVVDARIRAGRFDPDLLDCDEHRTRPPKSRKPKPPAEEYDDGCEL